LTTEKIESFLETFKIDCKVTNISQSNWATTIDLVLSPGVKVSSLSSISTELALALKTKSIPFINPITERGVVSLEFVNNNDAILFDDHTHSLMRNDLQVPLALGIARDGSEFVVDLQKMPHLLIAGETGSGKSVMLNCIINSMIESNKRIKLYMVDPKRVEFSIYKRFKNVKRVATDIEGTREIMASLEEELQNRLRKFERKKVANIIEFKEKKPKSKIPYLVLIADELASVMESENEKLLTTLAQLGRAAGIHVIAATQRPSVDTVKGAIKANFPARISCKVTSKTESRIIIDMNGAETLSGNGDAIIVSGEHKCLRFKGYYLNKQDVIKRLKSHGRWSWLGKIKS